jgi:uncharacterized protein DUF222
MDSNKCSPEGRERPPGSPPRNLAALAAAVEDLATEDLHGLSDAAQAEEVLALRGLVDRLEGQWLQRLAAVDGRGAAGAEQGIPAASTASWLRHRLRLGASAAHSAVRTARALFRGPLTRTAQGLCDGELSVAHASPLAHGTNELPDHTTARAEPVLVAAARRLDHPGCGGPSPTCSRRPIPTARTPRPSGAMRGGGCGWPRPVRAWWPCRDCWTPRPARP